MSLIRPYLIATCGQNSTSTFTLASNGILVDIFIDDIPIEPILPPDGGGIIPGQEWPPISESDESPCKKRVTVVATIKGVKYTETIIVENCVDLKVKDVDVDVTLNNDKPIITIRIKK